jgi:hypothetical protein
MIMIEIPMKPATLPISPNSSRSELAIFLRRSYVGFRRLPIVPTLRNKIGLAAVSFHHPRA